MTEETDGRAIANGKNLPVSKGSFVPRQEAAASEDLPKYSYAPSLPNSSMVLKSSYCLDRPEATVNLMPLVGNSLSECPKSPLLLIGSI